MITCCMDCERRGADCHSKCEAYLQQRAEHEEERAALSTIRARQSDAYAFKKNGRQRVERRKNKGR